MDVRHVDACHNEEPKLQNVGMLPVEGKQRIMGLTVEEAENMQTKKRGVERGVVG